MNSTDYIKLKNGLQDVHDKSIREEIREEMANVLKHYLYIPIMREDDVEYQRLNTVVEKVLNGIINLSVKEDADEPTPPDAKGPIDQLFSTMNFIKNKPEIPKFKGYVKTGITLMRPYVVGEKMAGISVSDEDTPEIGGMIAIGDTIYDSWYISKQYFEDNYIRAAPESQSVSELSGLSSYAGTNAVDTGINNATHSN